MYRGKFEAGSNDAAQKPEQAPAVRSVEAETATQPVRRQRPADDRRTRRRRRKRTTAGKLVFYGIYVLLILAFFIGMRFVMGALEDWLVEFEASQPDNQSEKVFQQHFAQPDWKELYALAGLEDTAFEGVDAYIDYMDKTVGDAPITMVETSAGLTGGKKYVIRADLGQEKYYNFATFALTDKSATDALMADWQLGEVQVFTWDAKAPQSMGFQRKLGYRFVIEPSSTVTVNGVVLGEEYVQRTVATMAEEYLPEGVHGYRLAELWVDGLLTEPTIVITDAEGKVADVTFDEETSTFVQSIDAPSMTDGERDTVVTAAKTYCQYMIGAVGAWDLRGYFDHETKIYNTITTNTTWMQGYSGFDFGEETVTDYYLYSDSLYSAKVTVDLNVTRTDGTIKVYGLSSTFFLEKQEEGWRVIEMTNVDVQEQTSMVRLTYVDGDKILASELVDAESRKLTPPQVTAPEGKVFRGWYVEAGKLDTGADGTIALPADYQLEPMTVYALFGAEEG